jgi:hypothetical protein
LTYTLDTALLPCQSAVMRLHNWSPPGISRRSRAISLDIDPAWDWLVAQDYYLARIGIAGDSAGRTACDHAAPELARAGEHQVWPGQMHVFQAMSALMPGISRVALAEITESVHRHLPIDPAGLPAAMEAIA